jgi:hypothetical protein
LHYLIGLITAVAMLIFALSRLQRAGLDLNALNPFLWYRRAQWKKLYATKPLYALDKPMEIAALLLVATAKCEGEVSAQQEKFLLDTFKNDFHLSDKEASELLAASAYLLRNDLYISAAHRQHETDSRGDREHRWYLELTDLTVQPDPLKMFEHFKQELIYYFFASFDSTSLRRVYSYLRCCLA